MKHIAVILISALSISSGVSQSDILRFTIDTSQEHQKIDGFSASDAWSMRFFGELSDDLQENVADLLFSQESDRNGNPKGIGLNIWRFNIGAGSSEQGENSQINNATRTDCFLLPDGSYDWRKQHDQISFIQRAQKRGVESILGFLNSPPVYFTKNGLATNTGRGGDYNLQEDKYIPFASFIGEVIAGLDKNHGIHLDYISPVNEPDGHWNWQGPKQEGTPATKYEIARLVRLLDQELEKRKLNTEIIIPESSDYRCMFSSHMTDAKRGYLIQSFFSPDSVSSYIGNLRHVPRLMAAHSYWTNTPVSEMKRYRQVLNDTLRKYGVDFWQSEVCIMGNDEEIGGGGGFDRTMKTALYVARIIHHDLVYANSRGWQWWRAVGGNYKDGLLFRNKSNSGNDTIVDSKLLWAMGNYSRFIRRNATRVEVCQTSDIGKLQKDSATDPWGVMVSAYKNPDGSIVAVAINYSEKENKIEFCLLDSNVKSKKRKHIYRTSDNNENLLHFESNDKTIILPPRSVSTIIF